MEVCGNVFIDHMYRVMVMGNHDLSNITNTKKMLKEFRKEKKIILFEDVTCF